jgi:hypothetical protein
MTLPHEVHNVHEVRHSPPASAAAFPAPETEIVAGSEAGPDASCAMIAFGQKGGQKFHGMEIAHTTNLYLLTAEVKMVKNIDPPMSLEQLAKRSIRPAKG